MYRRDYILRLIERFGRMLIAMRDAILRRETDPARVQAQLREIAGEAGLDLTIARSLDPASLVLWLAPTSDFDPGRVWLMAELLYLEALEAGSGVEAGGRADFERALALFSHLPAGWKPADGLATAAARAAEIRELLEDQGQG